MRGRGLGEDALVKFNPGLSMPSRCAMAGRYVSRYSESF
jgi:hypothetical protein